MPSTGLHQSVVIDAVVSKVDYQKDTAAFEGIVVSRGDTRITADRAQAAGLDFGSSRWTFDGNVQLSLPPHGTLRSDRAVVQFRDGLVTQATVTGRPAQFEQQRADTGAPLVGHANRIVYHATERAVELSGDAWLSDGRNEITGPLLVYNLREQTVKAASPHGNRAVRITIRRLAPAHGSGRSGAAATLGKAPEPERKTRAARGDGSSRDAPSGADRKLALPARPSISSMR